ncbi:serum amyloid P-component-like [Gouania willdenowi]|uniref:Pentraxin family member n=1 Tax=Gouania willdenowi TaxID=441366 RepID=A0A8C5GDH6_GOUWI|nr:serum amyloid P-component-like [Gouania willdenowi]
MKTLLFLLGLFATCYGKTEDLSGKVFVFPKETATDHVKLITSKTRFEHVSVCLRFITDLSRTYGIFSMSSPAQSNAFLLFKESTSNSIEVAVNGISIHFKSLSFPPNTWHYLCSTWSSSNGLAQLWLDGKPSIRRFVGNSVITGAPITLLGQEQDTYGGGFDKDQSFVGMISQVHMWDHVLPASEIRRYSQGKHITPGNVFNWKDLNYMISGSILLEEESEVV